LKTAVVKSSFQIKKIGTYDRRPWMAEKPDPWEKNGGEMGDEHREKWPNGKRTPGH